MCLLLNYFIVLEVVNIEINDMCLVRILIEVVKCGDILN